MEHLKKYLYLKYIDVKYYFRCTLRRKLTRFFYPNLRAENWRDKQEPYHHNITNGFTINQKSK